MPQETIRFSIDGFARGQVILQGYHIISAAVTIKFPKYHRGTQIETSILSSDSFMLPQVIKQCGMD